MPYAIYVLFFVGVLDLHLAQIGHNEAELRKQTYRRTYTARSPVQLLAFQRVMKGSLLEADATCNI